MPGDDAERTARSRGCLAPALCLDGSLVAATVEAPRTMYRDYAIIPLVERTPAWWEWRRSGIGSSDAAAILGDKHAKSAERVLLEKQGATRIATRHFAREQSAALERLARNAYIQAVGVTITPTCVQSLRRPWQRASLDGLSPDGERVIEIKCGLATYQRAAAHGRPPSHHCAQLQHILAVTGLPVIDYWCYVRSARPLRLEVRRDEDFIARLLAAEEMFWRRFAAADHAEPGDTTGA